MKDQLEAKARFLAYRWYRNQFLEVTHEEGFSFAEKNWQEYVIQAQNLLNDYEEDEEAVLVGVGDCLLAF